MAVPVKTRQDTQVFTTTATFADRDPHVTAGTNGDFAIDFGDTHTAGDQDLVTVFYRPDGDVIVGRFVEDMGTDYSQGSRYALPGGGNSIVTWRNTPHATGDSDIMARLENWDLGDGPSFLVNVGDTAGDQLRPEVVQLTGGALAFAWIDIATS